MKTDRTPRGEVVALGKAAPDFKLKTQRSTEWRLSDHLGTVVVLLFYPQNETLVCTKQLCSVRDNWDKYLDTGAEIVGISPATSDKNLTFAQRLNLPIQLLSDPGRLITQIYGKHRLFPINLTRALIVIDAKGIVRSRDVMLRAFRPKDDDLITNIYTARGDAFNDQYDKLRLKGPTAATR